MEAIENALKVAADWVWGPPLLILLCGTHLFLTVRLRFIQRYLITAIKISLRPTLATMPGSNNRMP